jgi:hypothetical protein
MPFSLEYFKIQQVGSENINSNHVNPEMCKLYDDIQAEMNISASMIPSSLEFFEIEDGKTEAIYVEDSPVLAQGNPMQTKSRYNF